MTLGVAAPQGSMVAPLWRGVDRIVVACEAPRLVATRLCAAAIADVRRDSPFPVTAFDAIDQPGRNDAIFRFRIDGGDSELVLLFSVERGVVVDDAEGVLTARPVQIASHGETELVAAVARSLDWALPWRRTGNARSRRQ